MDRWKSRGGKSQRREAKRRRKKIRERRSEKRKSQKTEDAGAQKGSKVAKLCVFPMICSSVRSKSRLAKALGAAELSGEMRIGRRCGAKHISKPRRTKHTSSDHFWKLICKSKYAKHTILRPTFGSWHVQKVHAVVARSTFPSQNVQSTPSSDHFWKLTCRKSARRCGAKHILKSKVLKTLGVRTTFGVRCRFAWQTQGIVHLFKSEQNVRVL